MSKFKTINRELSWLDFNSRVLYEAENINNPLLERLKFLSIVSSNFDEFFMIRVATLKNRLRANPKSIDENGQSISEQLSMVSLKVRELIERQYKCLRDVLISLSDHNISIASPSQWTDEERSSLEAYFIKNHFPILTPQRFSERQNKMSRVSSIANLRSYIAFQLRAVNTGLDKTILDIAFDNPTDLEKKDEAIISIVQLPPQLEKIIKIPSNSKASRFVFFEDIVCEFGDKLFPDWEILASTAFKVTRDADMAVDEDREDDFIEAMEEILSERQESLPVRLICSNKSPIITEKLKQVLNLNDEDVYTFNGPINLQSFMGFSSSEYLSDEKFIPHYNHEWPPIENFNIEESKNIFDAIVKSDHIIHVPYESFNPVIRFLEEAAEDSSVLAIKMTLYRTSGNSAIVRALLKAARNGKQVAVLVELKARFDEERNLEWAYSLEKAGAIVIYGISRLKVHAKACMIIKKTSEGGLKKFVHLSTGNYNEKTALLYSDISFFTANEEICNEVAIFFNMITGYSSLQKFNQIILSPFFLKTKIISLIEREASKSTKESPGLIMAKLNSLGDHDLIRALYKASEAGVKIMLNIRGVCCLIPGVSNMSDNISVTSILGRYLEHSRIIYFKNGSEEEVYLSSADWLERNFEKRIELMFPILDLSIKERIIYFLQVYFSDTAKSHKLEKDGHWENPKYNENAISAQVELYKDFKKRRQIAKAPNPALEIRRRPRDE